MISPLLNVLLYSAIPASTLVLGGIIAIYRSPGAILRSSIQHFAAGLVFAAVAVELLPDIMHEKAPIEVIIGFAVGVVAMLGIRQWAERTEASAAFGENNTTSAMPTSLLITVAVDVLTDGLLIGIGFAAGAKEGVLLTIALAIEILFLGLSTVTALRKARVKQSRALTLAAGLALLIVLGATVGATMLAGISPSQLEVVLSFGCAALLYLVTEELLVEAHEEKDTAIASSMFFVGFLLLLVLRVIG